MLIVETIARIRREHFIKGKTIKEIARDLKVSRNTVRKVLRSGETSFEYERAVQPRPKLGRWAADLDGLRDYRPLTSAVCRRRVVLQARISNLRSWTAPSIANRRPADRFRGPMALSLAGVLDDESGLLQAVEDLTLRHSSRSLPLNVRLFFLRP
jgi:hypothetical protein